NRIKNVVLTTYTTKNGLAVDDVRAIHEDHRGTLWIGTYGGGINRFRDGRFTALTMREGLSDNYAWCIYEDKEGVLWIGTENGLNRLKEGRVKWLRRDKVLLTTAVKTIWKDGRAIYG